MEYFIYKDNKQQGPFTVEQLAGMGLRSETLVWREGMEQWTPAWQVEELKDVLAGKAQSRPVPPPVPPQDAPHGNEEAPCGDRGGQPDAEDAAAAPLADKHKRRTMTWLAVAAVAFFVLLMTCPDERKHREAVSREVAQAVRDEIGMPDTGSETIDVLGGMLGHAIASNIVDAVINEYVVVDKYFIFSVGTLHYDGHDKTVSFGILGHVFTFSSADIRKAVHSDSPLPGTMAL